MTDRQKKPKQIDAEKMPKSEPGGNPLAQGLNVTVSVPKTIKIKMVDASVLADYERWGFLTSVISTAAIGFFVAYLQGPHDTYLLVNVLVWLILFSGAFHMTLSKKRQLTEESQDITFRASEIVGEPTNIEPKNA